MKKGIRSNDKTNRQKATLTHLRLLVEALPAATYSTDAQGHVVFLQPRRCRAVGAQTGGGQGTLVRLVQNFQA